MTVVDDGTIAGRRGSLSIDDEGNPTQCTTLIEDGILTGIVGAAVTVLGIQKPPFQLPDFITNTGITRLRTTDNETQDAKTLKAKQRERVQPKMAAWS